MSLLIDTAIENYDMFLKREALNFDQFNQFIHRDLCMDFHGFIDLYGIGSQFENSEVTPELTKLIYM